MTVQGEKYIKTKLENLDFTNSFFVIQSKKNIFPLFYIVDSCVRITLFLFYFNYPAIICLYLRS